MDPSSNPFLMGDMGGGFMDTMADSNPFLCNLSGKGEPEPHDLFGVPNAEDYNPDLNPFLMEASMGGGAGGNIFGDMMGFSVTSSYQAQPTATAVDSVAPMDSTMPTFAIQPSNDSPKSNSSHKDLILSVTSHMELTSTALLDRMHTAKTPIASPDSELHLVPSRDSPMTMSPEPGAMSFSSGSPFGAAPGAKSSNPFADFMMDTSAMSDMGTGFGQAETTQQPAGLFMGQSLFGSSEPSPVPTKEEPLVDLLGDFSPPPSMSTVPPMTAGLPFHQAPPKKTSLLDEGLDLSIGMAPSEAQPPSSLMLDLSAPSAPAAPQPSYVLSPPTVTQQQPEPVVSQPPVVHHHVAPAKPPPPKPPPPRRPPRPTSVSPCPDLLQHGRASPQPSSSSPMRELPSPAAPRPTLGSVAHSPKSSRQSSAATSPIISKIQSPAVDLPPIPSIAELLNQPVHMAVLAPTTRQPPAPPTTVENSPHQPDFTMSTLNADYGMDGASRSSSFMEDLSDWGSVPSGAATSSDLDAFGSASVSAAKQQIVPPGPESAVGRPSAPKRNFDTSSNADGIFSMPPPPAAKAAAMVLPHQDSVEFDAFASRFENAADSTNVGDPFGGTSAFGDSLMSVASDSSMGFENTDPTTDAFLAMTEPPPVPQSTPRHAPMDFAAESSAHSLLSYETMATNHELARGSTPAIPMTLPGLKPAVDDMDSPTDGQGEVQVFKNPFLASVTPAMEDGTKSGEDSKASTPLFELDQSEPLQPFPRTTWEDGVEFIAFEMQMRHPLKKKLTGQRFWKKMYVKLTNSGNIQVFNDKTDKEPVQELPLQPSYCVSDIAAQQYDQYGKIFTMKVQYIYYKERPGLRPGQVSKAERLTSRLSQFASYAIAGDLAGVKEFGSDIKKLGVPIEHTPQISELMKLGSHSYEDLKHFSQLVEELLFKIPLHRDRSLTYKQEEVQVTVVDEIYIEQELMGHVSCNIARVRVFFLAFLSGMPDIEVGLNDLDRQGKEVVGRHDILPVVTEEWIRLEDVEFHSCVQEEAFYQSKSIKLIPPDATYIELLRFRVRPPRNRELPLQVKTIINITGRKVEIRSDVLVPGSSGRKMGPVPCEDVAIRFAIPDCWIYMFRTEKHFRYGSVKSAHRRHGKVKGIERFLGTVETLDQAMMEVSSGQAKYEHHHKAIVWRMSRLPKEGQGAYTTHSFVCRLNLTAYDQMPEQIDKYCYVEFTMPATTVSHCVARSISVGNVDEPPEKYVRYLARHEYKVAIEFTQGQEMASYLAATTVTTSNPARPVSPAVSTNSAGGEGAGADDSTDSD